MTSEEKIKLIRNREPNHETWYKLLYPNEVFQILRDAFASGGAEAAQSECARMVQHNTDLNLTLEYHSPLMLAVKANDIEMAIVLLKNGADPNVRASNLCCPLFDAVAAHPGDVPLREKFIELFLAYGADADAGLGRWSKPEMATIRDFARSRGIELPRKLDRPHSPSAETSAVDRPPVDVRGKWLHVNEVPYEDGVVRVESEWEFDAALNAVLRCGSWFIRGNEKHKLLQYEHTGRYVIDASSITVEVPNHTKSPFKMVLNSSGKLASEDATWSRVQNEGEIEISALNEQLLAASKHGDCASCARLLEQGADIRSKDSNGVTPLIYAVFNNHVEVASLLITKGSEIEWKEPRGGRTPLGIAVIQGHLGALELLLTAGADVNARDNHQSTPLGYAALKGNIKVMEILLAKGADVNAKNDKGGIPLHDAASEGQTAAVGLLLAKGSDINAKTRDGFSPLQFAAGKGHTGTVALLLSSGADINVKDTFGQTPLTFAQQYGHTEVAKLLLSKAT